MPTQTANQEKNLSQGDLSVLDLKTEYRSLKENPVIDFYKPCLENSNHYRRAVGYFRSTVYSVIGQSILDFARRGGITELICSPELYPEDIESIRLGHERKTTIFESKLLQEINELLLVEEAAFNTSVLATLISVGALEIKVALRADRKGQYHEKIGVFSDNSGNAVSFKGSTNETWSGWHSEGNFESIEVFCSWRKGLEAERVSNHAAHFNSMWSENDSDIDVFSFPEEALAQLKKAAFEDLDSVPKFKKFDSSNVRSTPQRRSLLPHQDSALNSWNSQNGRGIFQHATGSGKTFTALMAVRQHIKNGNPALIVVPSVLLLEQWTSEIKLEIPQATLLRAGGGNKTWRTRQRLQGMTSSDMQLGQRVVLATMQTASQEPFLDAVSDGDHLLLVADEVHQIGSPEYSKIMDLNPGKRLGLSATPTRFGDPDGTKRILEYFGGIVPPQITLSDAIEAGRLVRYKYYPRTINLTATEADDWRDYTAEIGKEIARHQNNDKSAKPLSERAKFLLIQRSRIAKKASNKVQLACEILQEHFEESQSWLVYCEDADQLSQIIEALQNRGMEPREYHSKMKGDRKATMTWFRSFNGILVSIRCLDEGVDIPEVSHALILASSQNPRQFIQRRGRVLRHASNKQFAVVFDAIVTPLNIENEPEQTSLLKFELMRALEFSKNAINKGAGAELREIAINMGVNPDDLQIDGIEDEEEAD